VQSRSRGSNLRRWWLPVVLAVAAVVALVASDRAHRPHASVVWWVLAGSAALTLPTVPAVAQVRREKAEDLAELAREESQTAQEAALRQAHIDQQIALNDALLPLATQVARCAGAGDRARDVLVGELVQLVVSTLSHVVGPSRTRASYFAVEVDDAGEPSAFVCRRSSGRARQPHTSFSPDTLAGREVLRLVVEDDDALYPNLHEAVPPGLDRDRPREYETYLAVAVADDDIGYGMLTVDAPRAGDLKATDVVLTRVVARLLAAGLALQDRRTHADGDVEAQ